jgi:hypothetical protein
MVLPLIPNLILTQTAIALEKAYAITANFAASVNVLLNVFFPKLWDYSVSLQRPYNRMYPTA